MLPKNYILRSDALANGRLVVKPVLHKLLHVWHLLLSPVDQDVY